LIRASSIRPGRARDQFRHSVDDALVLRAALKTALFHQRNTGAQEHCDHQGDAGEQPPRIAR
jgi:hypothetical protein